MYVQAHVHIVDADSTRRAQIARQLYYRAIHPEIYENLDELFGRSPSHGAILLNDDLEASEENPLEAIGAEGMYLPVALFSEAPSPPKIVRAMLSGALDYLQWPFCGDVLQASVIRLTDEADHRGRTARRKTKARELVTALTRRERDVLDGLVAGESNKGIAHALGISPRTVEIHRGNMMTRLCARSTADAVRIGIYAGVAG